MSQSSTGDQQSSNQTKNKDHQVEEEKDPLEEMLDRTGCKQIHYSLQECMFEHRDWRKCQSLVQDLRSCMFEYEQRKAAAQIGTPNQPN